MPADTTIGLAAIRAAAERAAAEGSLHATAADIGMSYTGLRHFLAGGRPQRKTLRKLLEWHATRRRRPGRGGEEVSREDVEAAMVVLETYIAANGRESLRPKRVREVEERLFGKP